MQSTVTLRTLEFSPARFCAPLAGLTHSAFRRLIGELGGCGAVWTEMLAAKQVLREDLRASPYLRRRPVEPRVIYQLMVRDEDPLDRIIGRLSELKPDGIDINLACHAPVIRNVSAGSRLFEDLPALERTLRAARACWPGLLTAKVRLGFGTDGWKDRFAARLRAIEDAGVDAVVLHPRFFEDKFKRRARHELYGWAASVTKLPIIANGDITGPDAAAELASALAPCAALMVGRMAAVRPWVFAAWDAPAAVDHAEIWRRLAGYIAEDFIPVQALPRIKLFTKYYARNFKFGHSLYSAVEPAGSAGEIRERAEEFFGRSPALNREPSLSGL